MPTSRTCLWLMIAHTSLALTSISTITIEMTIKIAVFAVFTSQVTSTPGLPACHTMVSITPTTSTDVFAVRHALEAQSFSSYVLIRAHTRDYATTFTSGSPHKPSSADNKQAQKKPESWNMIVLRSQLNSKERRKTGIHHPKSIFQI